MPLDPAIWNRISQDDQEAYAIMYREYFRRFFNYGKKFVADEVVIEDAAHECLLLIWEKRSTLAEVKYPGTYFYTTFRNILISHIRQRRPEVAPDATLEDPGFNVEQLILETETGNEVKKQLQEAIRNLTPRQREAIFLRFYEGLSYEEVSAVLNITTKATYKIVARALVALKDIVHIPVIIIWMICKGFMNF